MYDTELKRINVFQLASPRLAVALICGDAIQAPLHAHEGAHPRELLALAVIRIGAVRRRVLEDRLVGRSWFPHIIVLVWEHALLERVEAHVGVIIQLDAVLLLRAGCYRGVCAVVSGEFGAFWALADAIAVVVDSEIVEAPGTGTNHAIGIVVVGAETRIREAAEVEVGVVVV